MNSRCGTPGRVALAALLAASLLLAGPAHADPTDRWASHIAQASNRFGIPQTWIRGVIRAESDGRTILAGEPIVSRAGAMGLMQLMPGTWRDMRALLDLGSDPHDPADNILAGTAYLKLMYDRFGYPGLFAAYNAGPARYAAYLAGARPLPAETRAYVAAVARTRPQHIGPKIPAPSRLFAWRATGMPVAPLPFEQTHPAKLFVSLSSAPGR